MAKGLSRNQILGMNDQKKEFVFIEEWNDGVWVRGLTGRERDEYESSLFKTKGTSVQLNLKNIRSLLVCLTCIDEDGNRLFTLDDIEKISEKSASALDKIATIASRMSGLSQQDQNKIAERMNDDPFLNLHTS